jgi:ABC-type transport system involved in cytochrome bd biosynthesis fused ATPase/permease subunit
MNTPTVREIFGGAPDAPIRVACDLVGMTTWLEVRGLDQPIANRISGGEKRRLAIASQLVTITDTTRVIILDEPEQGCDPPLARIHEAYPTHCIIVISHLERIATTLKWDHHIRF